MQAAPTLAVQIVNYRTRTYLERCLETVVSDASASGLAYEINLLDNASGEQLDDLASRFEKCRTFEADRNLGFGAGHNLLAARTEAPYLLILNPDVEFLYPDTAKRLLDAIRPPDEVKVVGPKLVTANGDAQAYDHGRLKGVRAQIAVRGGHSYWREQSARQRVAWVSGAALLVERAAFLMVGGFDENLFLYKEDEDLCLRLRETSAAVLYEPDVVVRHHGSVVADRRDELARASRYYFAKHFPNRRSQRAFAAAHQWLAYLRL
jgi:GT2 family glycosyltransferase